MRTLATLFAALLGLAFGSFLNVCLSRWPEGESISMPRSHCRNCQRTLSWFENIPLFSWLALRGRCRTCRAWIGVRYPLVEVLIAVLWAFIIWRGFATNELAQPPWLLTLTVVPPLILTWLLVALATLDAESFWLPNFLTFAGIVLGLFATLLPAFKVAVLGKLAESALPELIKAIQISPARIALDLFLPWLLAVLIPAGLLLLVRWTYKLLRKQEGLGLGDVKLMAMLGAWLGLAGALESLVLGTLLCTLAALVLLALPRREGQTPWAAQKLPLGTFLCAGGLISALWGKPILDVYLRWAGF